MTANEKKEQPPKKPPQTIMSPFLRLSTSSLVTTTTFTSFSHISSNSNHHRIFYMLDPNMAIPYSSSSSSSSSSSASSSNSSSSSITSTSTSKTHPLLVPLPSRTGFFLPSPLEQHAFHPHASLNIAARVTAQSAGVGLLVSAVQNALDK